jgi:hypothetical protein
VANGRVRELSRFFCDNCNSMVFPHTKFDAETVAPEPGKRGEPILLSTYNNSNRENQVAWCLNCKDLVGTRRLGEVEIWSMYIHRRGVTMRFDQLRDMVPRKVVMMNKKRFVA